MSTPSDFLSNLPMCATVHFPPYFVANFCRIFVTHVHNFSTFAKIFAAYTYLKCLRPSYHRFHLTLPTEQCRHHFQPLSAALITRHLLAFDLSSECFPHISVTLECAIFLPYIVRWSLHLETFVAVILNGAPHVVLIRYTALGYCYPRLRRTQHFQWFEVFLTPLFASFYTFYLLTSFLSVVYIVLFHLALLQLHQRFHHTHMFLL